MKNLTLLSKHAISCNWFSTFKLLKLFGCNQLHIVFVPLASIEYEWVKQNQFVESEDHEYFCLSFLLFVYFPTLVLNPYPPGGGGGSNWPAPVRNPWLPCDHCRSRHAFSWVFSFKSFASFDTKFSKIRPSIARWHDVLYSHVGTIFAQNCLCTKHMEIIDFLKMR